MADKKIEIYPPISANLSRREFLLGSVGTIFATLTSVQPASTSDALNAFPQLSDGIPIRSVKTRARNIALTFDDMWFEYIAHQIGSAFAKHGIRLTFFPTGRVVRNNLIRPQEGYENLYSRLKDMGHEFGCHLYTHHPINDLSLHQLIDEEMEPTLTTLRRAFGPNFQPVAIRPPFGIVTESLRQLSRRYSIPLVLWDIDSRDAICTRQGKDPEDCVDEVMANIKKRLRPGSIVLQHGILVSYLAIEPLVEFLSELQLQPITLSALLDMRYPDPIRRPIEGEALRPY